MTRLTRFAAWSGVFTVVYALVWLRVLSVPFLDASIVEQLLPVVCLTIIIICCRYRGLKS